MQPGEYVEKEVFDSKIDSVDSIVSRKKALSDRDRWGLLYVIYENQRIGRGKLESEIENLDEHLSHLIETNLVAKIPHPSDDGMTIYRITKLGEQQIESDLPSSQQR